jgi:predicted ferric reductase
MGLNPMKKSIFLPLFLLSFALVPVFLAWNQDVPVRFVYQGAVLFVSMAAFGVLLGQFWLSRLWPSSLPKIRFGSLLRWHKVIGYTAGVIMLVHPVLMIARRFWVQESQPLDNLLIMLRAPALLPAIAAWILLALIVVLSLVRRHFPGRSWRILHGLLSSGFAGLATWHVVAVGRHSNTAMSAFWIVLAAAAIAALLLSYVPAFPRVFSGARKGVAYETAQQ